MVAYSLMRCDRERCNCNISAPLADLCCSLSAGQRRLKMSFFSLVAHLSGSSSLTVSPGNSFVDTLLNCFV